MFYNTIMYIKKLDRKDYQDYPVPIEYDTDAYYDIIIDDGLIKIEKKELGYTYHHLKEDSSERLFQEWLDDPVSFGAFEGDELIGVIEFYVDWSSRIFINLLKVDKRYQRRGIARSLMDKVKEVMYEKDIRAIILETQSCNVKAIAFYKSQGFKLIGFDTICYSNHDIERKEVRFDLGFINKNHKE